MFPLIEIHREVDIGEDWVNIYLQWNIVADPVALFRKRTDPPVEAVRDFDITTGKIFNPLTPAYVRFAEAQKLLQNRWWDVLAVWRLL